MALRHLWERKGRYSESEEKSRLRTANARAAARLSRLRRSLCAASSEQQQGPEDADDSFAKDLQERFFSACFIREQHSFIEDRHTYARQRARCTHSLIKALASMLTQLFAAEAPFHVINCQVVDDTTVRLRPSADEQVTTGTSVWTVMNIVQSLHVRFRSEGAANSLASSVSIPMPLTLLETPTSARIYTAFISAALVSSLGVGQFFQRFGVDVKLLSQARFRTYIFIGDALKANDSAMKLERWNMICQKANDPARVALGLDKNLILKFKCAIHQVCLIRKPIVLMIPRFWTTLVRLGHLFESAAWKRQFAKAMASVIIANFQYFAVAKHPAEMQKWQAQAARLCSVFRSQSSRRVKALHDCFEIANGDVNSPTVFHWCKPDSEGKWCCANRAEALVKCTKALIFFFLPWLPSALAVPLQALRRSILIHPHWLLVSLATDPHTFLLGLCHWRGWWRKCGRNYCQLAAARG